MRRITTLKYKAISSLVMMKVMTPAKAHTAKLLIINHLLLFQNEYPNTC